MSEATAIGPLSLWFMGMCFKEALRGYTFDEFLRPTFSFPSFASEDGVIDLVAALLPSGKRVGETGDVRPTLVGIRANHSIK